ncbi:MAG: hypothetical protein UHD09_07105 [Bifidobacterium sp.]|nr:hypothetical protein [Bifidobacterium sp.]
MGRWDWNVADVYLYRNLDVYVCACLEYAPHERWRYVRAQIDLPDGYEVVKDLRGVKWLRSPDGRYAKPTVPWINNGTVEFRFKDGPMVAIPYHEVRENPHQPPLPGL